MAKQASDQLNVSAESERKLNDIIHDGVRANANYRAEIERVTKALNEKKDAQLASVDKQTDSHAIELVNNAYKRLAEAQREYLAAMKSGNGQRMAYWNGELQLAQQALDELYKNLDALDLSESAYNEITQKLRDATAASAKFNDQMKE